MDMFHDVLRTSPYVEAGPPDVGSTESVEERPSLCNSLMLFASLWAHDLHSIDPLSVSSSSHSAWYFFKKDCQKLAGLFQEIGIGPLFHDWPGKAALVCEHDSMTVFLKKLFCSSWVSSNTWYHVLYKVHLMSMVQTLDIDTSADEPTTSRT